MSDGNILLEECRRIRQTKEDRPKLSARRIASIFDRSETGIEPHLNGQCDHSNEVPVSICKAIRELHTHYNLSSEEIERYFEFSKDTIHRHAKRRCSHD